MIEDARKIPRETLISTDVCIVGAGAAGITIARQLSTTGVRVALLVGGGPHERPRDRDLYRGVIASGSVHEPLEENRRRRWGGTTAAWGGRCVPLDPIDFDQRPHVPNSGWPIQYSDLFPYYRRAIQICEAGDFSFDAPDVFPSGPREMIPGFDGTEIVTSRLERWSPPTNFARRYGPELQRARNVRVLMDGHALGLELNDSGSRVRTIRAAASPGTQFYIRARTFILAAGGLENARLLLDSHIPSPYDNTGRYYMSHLAGSIGTIELRIPIEHLVYGFERDSAGVYIRRRFWVTPAAQQRSAIGNVVAFLDRPDMTNAEHRDPLYSSTYLAKSYLTALQSRSLRQARHLLESQAQARSRHWQVVHQGALGLLPDAIHIARHRWIARRRLPAVLGSPSSHRLVLHYNSEHCPSRQSRVTLASDRDSFGMRRLQVKVHFSELDVRTVAVFHNILGNRLEQSGVGTLNYKDPDIEGSITRSLQRFNSNAHHLGTTRMADRPQDGVVNRDGRVFGVHNLFVAGSSLFPTGGHANPTLTIVALSLRLADHLTTANRLARA